MAHVQQLLQPQFQTPLNWDPMMMRVKMKKKGTFHHQMVSLLVYKHRNHIKMQFCNNMLKRITLKVHTYLSSFLQKRKRMTRMSTLMAMTMRMQTAVMMIVVRKMMKTIMMIASIPQRNIELFKEMDLGQKYLERGEKEKCIVWNGTMIFDYIILS